METSDAARTFYNWKAKNGGMTVSEARLRALEEENRRLKKLLAESVLDVSALIAITCLAASLLLNLRATNISRY